MSPFFGDVVLAVDTLCKIGKLRTLLHEGGLEPQTYHKEIAMAAQELAEGCVKHGYDLGGLRYAVLLLGEQLRSMPLGIKKG